MLNEGSLGSGDGFSEFPVSFSIELISSYKNHTSFFLSCVKEEQVCRKSLILIYLDNIPNSYILTINELLPTPSLQSCILLLINLLVSLKPQKVIPSFFDHRNDEHKGQWSHICEQEADSQNGEELGDGNHEEEEVEEELELVVQDHRDESQNVVLLIHYLVVAESCRLCSSRKIKLSVLTMKLILLYEW